MDISFDNEDVIRKCYKCEESVLYKLNISYNSSNSTVILWNKFQIYVYEDLELNYVSKVIIPEFQIHNFITSTNYLVCMDSSGNVHTTSLKFKNAATQKRFKSSFQTRESGIMACSLFSEDIAICLKYESNAYFLSIHKINSGFQLEKLTIIMCNESLPFQENKNKYILKSYPVPETHMERLQTVFNRPDLHSRSNWYLVLVSFDRLTVYGCLFSAKCIEEDVTIVKLYKCPTQISDLEIIDVGEINIIIGLQLGTIVILDMKESMPKFVHLNKAIYKFLVFKDNILYTDGMSMWIAERILSEAINFTELFVKSVYDFIKFGDQVICTTYNNLIYTFSLDDERTYVKVQTIDEYCPVQKLFENPQYLDNILKLVKDNDDLLKRQKAERDYIMALSISSRQDVMDDVIKQKVIVYESYEDAVAANADLILTSNTCEYFDKDSFYFLISILALQDHRLGDILSNSVGDLRLHVTLKSDSKIVKTNTINITTDILTKITVLIPLKIKFININEMRVDIKIVTNVPNTYHTKHKTWSVLYRKSVILNSEHFMKFNSTAEKKIICIKEPNVTLEELILETAKHQYGSILEFTKMSSSLESKTWQMYVRLPTDYQSIMRNENTRQKFASKKVNYFLQLVTAEDFLQSKRSIYLTICNEKVKIDTDNDGFTTPSFKISCNNVKITFDIRNFLSNLVYCLFADPTPGKEYISHSFYVTVENLQLALKDPVNASSEEVIQELIEQFERKVIGALPI